MVNGSTLLRITRCEARLELFMFVLHLSCIRLPLRQENVWNTTARHSAMARAATEPSFHFSNIISRKQQQ